VNQRRRILATAAAIALAACGLSACGTTDSDDGIAAVSDNPTFPAGTTMARLAEAGKITIGTKFDVPLFGLKDSHGIPSGFDVEIAKIIAGKLGIAADDIEWVEASSKVKEDYLVQGKADLIVATYTITDERRRRVTFGGPYYDAGSTLMVNSGNEKNIIGPSSLDDPSIRVCTATGSFDGERIKEYLADPDSQLVQVDTYSQCAKALRSGTVDAVTTDSAILLGLVAASDGAFETVGVPFYYQQFGIGIKKGDLDFCEFINDVLAESDKNGSFAKAWKKTVGDAAPDVPKLPYLGPCE
jgi:glutamate transport system substrate-binding protein